jgi:DNA (cytosine-5)-methyltransferase 1
MPKYEPHRFPFRWNIADGYPAKGIEAHNSTVFGTFICGGGSSMGYKLAGFHHLGGVELDPKVAETYKLNHHPELLYNEDIRDFNKREDLPPELYNLDLLDGSPPCSTFSTAGSRDKAWGKEKHFTEGQKLQTLDDLVFVYCDTILKLRPKCFLLENVSGIIKGNAKSYSRRIVEYLNENGYDVQVFCLNAATMGVPQTRERVFFIGHRKEYHLPKLVLKFNEKPIPFGEVYDKDGKHEQMTDYMRSLWDKRKYGDKDMSDIKMRTEGKVSLFSHGFLYMNRVAPTITSTNREKHTSLFEKPEYINDTEISLCSTFPQDYQSPYKDIGWLCGMSVPPVMTAQISYQIYKQWLSKIR